MNRLLPAFFLFSALLFTIGSCSMANYGKLKSEPEVTQAFEAYQILPGHKYYYWGTASRPVAIAGIKENYNSQKYNYNCSAFYNTGRMIHNKNFYREKKVSLPPNIKLRYFKEINQKNMRTAIN